MKLLSICLIMMFGLLTTVRADSWSLPTEEKYCSENKKFCLKVQPKKLESRLAYFQDKVDEKENAGADKKMKENFCKGLFYSKGKKLWNVKLDNEVSPVDSLISNNGDFVITFDNWHGTGYGDNVVAIYDASNGNLIKKLSLSDFLTESDIYKLPHSTSSIQWSGEHRIDYENRHLILKVVKGKSDYFTVRIDLTNGTVLDEKIDRLPSLKFLFVLDETQDNSSLSNSITTEGSNCQNGMSSKQIYLNSTEFLGKALNKELPGYPVVAKVVGARGISVLNVFVNENGDVECIDAISGHTLLRTYLANSVKKWKFEKSDSRYAGKIIIEGKSILLLNGKVVE